MVPWSDPGMLTPTWIAELFLVLDNQGGIDTMESVVIDLAESLITLGIESTGLQFMDHLRMQEHTIPSSLIRCWTEQFCAWFFVWTS